MYGSAFTGIGKHVERLLWELSLLTRTEKRTDTFVIFCEPKNSAKIAALSPHFETIEVSIPHYSLSEQFVYPRILQKARLDLMHFPHFNAPILYRGRSIVTIHDLILSFYPGKSVSSWLKEGAYRMTIRSIVERATAIITVSSHTKKDLVELMQTDDAKIRVIHNGVDAIFSEKVPIAAIEEVKKKLGIQSSYLLYMGLHREHKNLGRLVRAFKLLIDGGYSGQLILAGKEDPRTGEAREAVRELGLRSRVIFPWHLDFADTILLLQGAELYIMPSLYEGFGLPILEAMASGTPVVASKTTSLPEVGGPAARYFHPLRIDEIAKTITEVLKDPTIQAEMIEKWYAQARGFSWEKMGKETLALYQESLRR